MKLKYKEKYLKKIAGCGSCVQQLKARSDLVIQIARLLEMSEEKADSLLDDSEARESLHQGGKEEVVAVQMIEKQPDESLRLVSSILLFKSQAVTLIKAGKAKSTKHASGVVPEDGDWEQVGSQGALGGSEGADLKDETASKLQTFFGGKSEDEEDVSSK